MKYTELDLPLLDKHETLDILDSSKLQTLMDCPHKFFIEHVMGWKKDTPNVHFAFGSGWHDAMEVMMRAVNEIGYSPDVITFAYQRFLDTFREAYPDELMWQSLHPKDPANAAAALEEYARLYSDDSFETLFTEIAGTVPVSQDRVVHFKLDSIIKDKDGYWSMEHKTTGRRTQSWLNKWSTMLQVGVYSHALYTLYGDEARGVKINGAILRRMRANRTPNNEFVRLPIHTPPAMMQKWMYEVNEWIMLLDRYMLALERADPSDDTLRAFPRNGISCGKFGCSHPGICSSIANPLRFDGNPPIGYKVEHWDPRREEDGVKHVVHLDKDTEIKPVQKDAEL